MFCDKLLIGNWHLHLNGPTPLRYSPYLCGGAPLYGDPEDIFFSLLQALAYLMDFWIAYNITIVFHLIIGYIAWMFVGRDVLHLKRSWAHLFALIIISNGFYLSHIILGHATFLTFPLIGILAWCLLDRRTDTVRTLLTRTALFALTCGWILYAGGYFVLMSFFVGMLYAIPAEILWNGLHSARSRTLVIRSMGFIVASLLIGASKLMAIYSVMRFYPRKVDVWMTGGSIVSFPILSVFWRIPQSSIATMVIPGGFHEKSMLVSPVTFLGTLLAPLVLIKVGINKTSQKWQIWKVARLFAFSVFTILYLWLMQQMILGKGEVMPFLHELPILSSWRVNLRFLYVLLLFLSAASIWVLSIVLPFCFRRWEGVIVALLSLITLASFYVGYANAIASIFELSRSYNDCKSIEQKFDRGRALLPVSKVSPKWQQYIDGATGMRCPIALYWIQNFPHSTVLSTGNVFQTKENTFNLINPACDAYPEANGCTPGSRIAVNDLQNFENFRNGLPVTWNISPQQHFSDWASFVMLIASLAIFAVL